MQVSFARFLEWLYYSDVAVCAKGCLPADLTFKFQVEDQLLQIRHVTTPTYKLQQLETLMQGCNIRAVEAKILRELDYCMQVLVSDHD